MTNTIWPVNTVNGSPLYAGRALRQTTIAPFVPMSNTARPLGGLSGIRFGTPSSVVVATSAAWTVKPHVGIIDRQVAAEAGPYIYSVDANVNGSMTPADQTNPRIDTVYVQVNDNSEDGSGLASVVVGIVVGTPSASPATPAAPARSLTLATVNVPAVGGGAPTVTLLAPFVGGDHVPVFQTLDALQAVTTAPVGTLIDLANGDHYRYAGGSSGWQIDRPFASAAGTGGNATVANPQGLVNQVITFPAGRFTQPPVVTASGTSGRFTVAVIALSATSATLQFQNNATTAGAPGTFYWTAVQMTAASAAG